jgi:hypothetical protein
MAPVRWAAIVVLVAGCGHDTPDHPPDAAPGIPLACPYQDPHQTGSNVPPFEPPLFASGSAFDAMVTIPDAQPGAMYAVTLAVQSAQNPATLSGTATITTADGTADFSDVSIDRWGAATIVASGPGLSPCTFDVHIHASRYQWSTQPSDVVAGQRQSVLAALTDITGSTVLDEPNYGETWYAIGDPGCPPVGERATQAVPGQLQNGVITFNDVAVTNACSGYRLTMGDQQDMSSAYYSGSPSDSFAVVPAAPELKLTATPTTAYGIDGNGMWWWSVLKGPVTFVVKIADRFDNPIATPTTFTLTGVPGGPLSLAAPSGQATFTGITFNSIGTVNVSVADSAGDTSSLGIWVSAWQPRITNLNLQYPTTTFFGVAVSADDPDTVWLSASDGIRVSHDGALTFTQVSSMPGRQIVADPTPGSNRLYMTTLTMTSVVRSDDGGVTWSTPAADLTPLDPLAKLVIDPTDPARLFVISTDGVWRSDDAATTWSTIAPAFPDPYGEYYDVTLGNDGTVYVTAESSMLFMQAPDETRPLFWKSTDHGATWTTIPISDWIRYVWVDPYSGTLFASRPSWELNSHLASSTDGGVTWTAHPEPGYTGQLMFFPDHMLASLTAPSMYLVLNASRDGGATWIAPPMQSLDPDFAAVGAQVVAPSNPSIVYALTGNGVSRSDTAGF